MNKKIRIRPEEHKDYKGIISLILRSFQEGTDYSAGTETICDGFEKCFKYIKETWSIKCIWIKASC